MLDLGQPRATDSQGAWWVRYNYNEWSHTAVAESQHFVQTADRLDSRGTELETRYANRPNGTYPDPQGTVTIKSSAWNGSRTITLMSTDTSLQVERQGDSRTVRQRINVLTSEYQQTPSYQRVTDGKTTDTLYADNTQGHKKGDFVIQSGWDTKQFLDAQSNSQDKYSLLVRDLSISKDSEMRTHGCDEFCVKERTKHERIEVPGPRPEIALRYTWDQTDRGVSTDSYVKDLVEVHADGSSHERYEHYPTLGNRYVYDPPVRVTDEPAKVPGQTQ